jgi:hypothetical protein
MLSSRMLVECRHRSVRASCSPWRTPDEGVRVCSPIGTATRQSVCKLATPTTPTDACIPFLFSHSPSLRLRRRPTERHVSHLFSRPCGRFPSQQGGTPPSSTQSPQRQQGLIHLYLLCFQMFTDSSAQWASATLFFSIDSGLFPLQWGCIPLLYPERYPRKAVSSSRSHLPRNHSNTGDFDPAGQTLAFHRSRVTSHGSRVTPSATSNRSGQTPLGLPYAPCPSFQIVGRASVWEG